MRIEEQMQVGGMRRGGDKGKECKQINSDIDITNDTSGIQ